jgi:hypothetical protein
MYKKIMLFIALCSSLALYTKQNHILLTSPVIEFLDGKPWGIDGEAIGYMRQVGLNIIKMQYGTFKASDNAYVGMFDFEGNLYSIKQLIALNREFLRTMPSGKTHEKLMPCLAFVVEYFIETIQPFMGQARGAKSQVTVLIGEWAEKHNRKDSDLLRWAETTEDEEFNLFKKNIQSFEALDNFCTDLVCFLGDLIRSCPRANKQFEVLKEKFFAQQQR